MWLTLFAPLGVDTLGAVTTRVGSKVTRAVKQSTSEDFASWPWEFAGSTSAGRHQCHPAHRCFAGSLDHLYGDHTSLTPRGLDAQVPAAAATWNATLGVPDRTVSGLGGCHKAT